MQFNVKLVTSFFFFHARGILHVNTILVKPRNDIKLLHSLPRPLLLFHFAHEGNTRSLLSHFCSLSQKKKKEGRTDRQTDRQHLLPSFTLTHTLTRKIK